ncbi:Fe2+ or Zn2+ uptake regulation protein [Aequitasia blattaphilus]|uniref:Transcriptional repressor n=1 Tax=Aequitasia blattaphilus TaxID=2949332 RepID=A0ABT1E9V1_9FIRM|nr:transcriptional repressor [Aequitasia blattaphilus]MCP1102384.1 transcriptional repressor [Aequitasia blattaphilus]MCR8615024.1 transcriptional repressor [Aequitasia blattaphilus]
MQKLKYSKQRAYIKEYLMQTEEHPTADTVYLHMRKQFPNISLGTVYRNLNLLADMGEIIKITTENGGVRFDKVSVPHYHVICTKCGKVDDLMLTQKDFDELDKKASKSYSGEINTHAVVFYGVCEDCLRVDKSENP